MSVTIGVKRFCRGFEVLKPILHGLGGQKNNSITETFYYFGVRRAGFQVWTSQNVQVPPKRAGFQV